MAGDKKRPGSAPDKKKKKSIEIPFGYETVMNAPLGKPLTSPKLKKRLIQRREKTIKTIPKRKVRKNNFVDIVDKTKRTALHVATKYKNLECIKLLVKYNAALNAESTDGIALVSDVIL